MMTPLAKHRSVIDEAIARLLARAADARGLKPDDLRPRVEAALEKYLFKDRADAASADVRAFIDELRADDLCLILACERGAEPAWEELVKNFDGVVKSAARKISASGEDAEDLAGSIWAELYGLKQDKDGRVKTKLSYYSGRGSLAGWLRAVVGQLAVDEFRKQSKLVQIEEDREFENLASEAAAHEDNLKIVAHGQNPEELFSEKEAQRDVAEAFREAIAALGAEDRLILKLYYFDDLKLKDIGAALGFHEATASRKLVRIQTEIRSSVEKLLRARHGWSETEVKRFLSETASKLGISFEKLLTVMTLCAVVQEFFTAGVL